MKQDKTKAMQKALTMLESLIFLIPGILLEVIECAIKKVKTKNDDKISGFLIYILETIQMVIYLPLSPIQALINKYFNILEKRLIDEDSEFQEFAKSELCKKTLLVDNKVKVTILFKPTDFNDDIYEMYDSYNKAMEIVKELETKVSDDLKHGMYVLNSRVYIVSKSLYESKNGKRSLGCFYPSDKSIHIKMHSEIKCHLDVLHHEMGHFIDFVVGFDSYNQSFGELQSNYDEILHEVFEEESQFLRGYGRTNYCEFFAVAYEHKMTNGVMDKLKETDNIIKEYLNVFNWVISYIEDDYSFEY